MSKTTETSTADRICAVMKAIRSRLSHDGKFGYEYTSADAMYELLRPLLAEHGLVLRFNIIDWTEETVTPRSGKPFRWAKIKAEFSFNDDAPETRIQGVALYGPQGYGAAATYLQKYWLRGKLFLATGEDDLDGVEPTAPPAQAPSAESSDVLTELRWIADRTQKPVLCSSDGLAYNELAASHIKAGSQPRRVEPFIAQYNADRAVGTILFNALRADEGTISEDQRARIQALFDRHTDRLVVDAHAKELAKALEGIA